MKKSSLGRRSSVASQGRSSSSRKSFIPKPCSGPSKPGRASSLERDSVVRDTLQSGLRRSKSYLGLDFSRPSSCFMTPVQSHVRNVSAYRTHMSEGGRPSSFGGKSAKKESRPIADKNFQIEAQTKVTEFFSREAPELLEKGSIKPMTTAMFIDLVNFILQKHVFGLVINRNNIVDEIMRFCKMYHYRGKAEKSWLCTVNAPHSWPSVVGFLVWLVEWHQLSQAFDPFTACYPEQDEGGAEFQEQDHDFKNMIPCLLNGYNQSCRKNPPGDDSKEIEKYLEYYRTIRGVDDSELKKLNQEYYLLQEELNSFNAEDTADIEKIEDLEKQKKTIRDDMRKMKEYVYGMEEYQKNAQEKIAKCLSHIQTCKTNEPELNMENKRLKAIISQQTMSSEERKEIESQMASLQNDIQLLSQDTETYQNEAYKEDLDLVSQRRMFDNGVREYNRLVSLNLVSFPELKNTLIDTSLTKCMDAPNAAERFVKVDEDLKELKLHLNAQINTFELEIENIEAIRRTNENELQANQKQLEKCHEECGNWKTKLERVADEEKQENDRFNITKALIMKDIDKEEENLEKLDEDTLDYETRKIGIEKRLEKKYKDIENFKKILDEDFKMRLDDVEKYSEMLYKSYEENKKYRKERVRQILGEEYLLESDKNRM